MYVLLLSQQGLVIVQRPEPALQLGGDKRLARLIQRLQGARLQRKAVQPPGVRVQHVPQRRQTSLGQRQPEACLLYTSDAADEL